MPVLDSSPIQTRERAEIRRSSVEATLTADGALRSSAKTLTRYERPPADTPYPLEYSYHLLGDVRGSRIVDFGCGSGSNSVLLAGRGAHVIGVDISEDLIRLARRRMAANRRDGVSFVVGSAHDLPLPSGSVDVVFGIAVLHHLDLRLVSREVHRVLKPGGRAIFQEPVRNSAVVRFVRSLIPYRAPDISPYERPLTDKELSTFAAPFSAVRLRTFALPHVAVGQVVPWVRRRVGWLYHTDAWLLARFGWLRYYAGISVIEVTK
jgi:SAM-dependent methyltransferase